MENRNNEYLIALENDYGYLDLYDDFIRVAQATRNGDGVFLTIKKSSVIGVSLCPKESRVTTKYSNEERNEIILHTTIGKFNIYIDDEDYDKFVSYFLHGFDKNYDPERKED